jgi:antitoxin MazE6
VKTTVSIPDDVFESAKRLARRERRSRSDLYSAALTEYVARHSADEITDALNRVAAEIDHTIDPFVSEAAAQLLKQSEW